MSTKPTGQWSPASFEPSLIRLNAADDMQHFWEATKALLHGMLAIFRAFMRPCGDRYQAYIILWESEVFQGLVGLHRTLQQRDFTDTEVHLLER